MSNQATPVRTNYREELKKAAMEASRVLHVLLEIPIPLVDQSKLPPEILSSLIDAEDAAISLVNFIERLQHPNEPNRNARSGNNNTPPTPIRR